MSRPSKNNRILRWVALVAVLLNIAFNYYSNINPINGQTIGEVSNKYPTLFTPAGYAFSIWGLIYLSFIIYLVIQLLPKNRSEELFDKLSIPLIITSLLSIFWIIAFSLERLTISEIALFGMLITALVLFFRVKRGIEHNKKLKWISIPFGLYAGWLTVASIAGTATWLYSLNWKGGALGEVPWTIIMVLTALIIGIFVSWKFETIVFPLVIAWAAVAIWQAQKEEYDTIAYVGLIAATILSVWSVGFGLKLFPKYFYRTS